MKKVGQARGTRACGRRSVSRGQLAVGVILLSAASALTACAGTTTPTALKASPEVASTTEAGGSAAGVGDMLATSQPVFIQRAIAQGPSTPAAKAKPKSTHTPTSSPSTNPSTSNGGDDSTPSGEQPATTLAGFSLKYLQQFDSDSVPSGWDEYSGGDSGPQSTDGEATFDPGMCQFNGGEAHFMAEGTSTCGMHYAGAPQEYGAWFIRMKGDAEPTSSSVFDNIMLLWPDATAWPPEIDIYEDNGNRAHTSEAMYNTVDSSICGSTPAADCLNPYSQGTALGGGIPNDDDEWHTYGVEWTPSGVNWYIDGNVVASAPASAVKSGAAQPATTMDLDLQVQNQGSGVSGEVETMAVDWLEQFSYGG